MARNEPEHSPCIRRSYDFMIPHWRGRFEDQIRTLSDVVSMISHFQRSEIFRSMLLNGMLPSSEALKLPDQSEKHWKINRPVRSIVS